MRQYISDVMPNDKGILETDERGFKHLHNSLRAQVGDMVCVRFPDGSLCDMTVCKIYVQKKVILLQRCDVNSDAKNIFSAEMNIPELWLFMFIAKPQKMEQVIRQATECGVARIIPVIGEYSQAGNVAAFNARSGNERFAKIVREAREQSGSAVATEILKAMTVNDAAEFWKACVNGGELAPEHNCAVVLYERNDKTKRLNEVVMPHIKKAAVAVGCEGGIAPDEIDVLCKAGFAPVHFETNILRCETAALYGIAAMQTAMTEKSL